MRGRTSPVKQVCMQTVVVGRVEKLLSHLEMMSVTKFALVPLLNDIQSESFACSNSLGCAVKEGHTNSTQAPRNFSPIPIDLLKPLNHGYFARPKVLDQCFRNVWVKFVQEALGGAGRCMDKLSTEGW